MEQRITAVFTEHPTEDGGGSSKHQTITASFQRFSVAKCQPVNHTRQILDDK